LLREKNIIEYLIDSVEKLKTNRLIVLRSRHVRNWYTRFGLVLASCYGEQKKIELIFEEKRKKKATPTLSPTKV